MAPIRHPLHLAEEAAVVDLLSGGRLELGIGAGYVPSEFDAFGTEMAARFTDLDAMYVRLRELFDEPGLMPPPLQPHLPVWLGYQQAIGARKAGRVGAPLLSIRRATVAAYLEGLSAEVTTSRRRASPATSTSSSPTIRRRPISGSRPTTCTN